LKTRIVGALTNYMNRPEVTLEVRQVNSKRFFMTGEVGRPGAFTIISPITVLEAISNAGGLRDFANGKKIVIMRGNERLKFNYKEVIKGKNMEQNIMLQPGDHIIVP
jgi:polysaccharide export outer membrane protein